MNSIYNYILIALHEKGIRLLVYVCLFRTLSSEEILERDTQRERQTETEAGRQTDRQTDRQTTDKQTEGERRKG